MTIWLTPEWPSGHGFCRGWDAPPEQKKPAWHGPVGSKSPGVAQKQAAATLKILNYLHPLPLSINHMKIKVAVYPPPWLLDTLDQGEGGG
jgi:hypothetical protein